MIKFGKESGTEKESIGDRQIIVFSKILNEKGAVTPDMALRLS